MRISIELPRMNYHDSMIRIESSDHDNADSCLREIDGAVVDIRKQYAVQEF